MESWLTGFPAIAFGVTVFLLTRELWCWYFKCNQMVTLLSTQVEYGDLLLKELKAVRSTLETTTRRTTGNEAQQGQE